MLLLLLFLAPFFTFDLSAHLQRDYENSRYFEVSCSGDRFPDSTCWNRVCLDYWLNLSPSEDYLGIKKDLLWLLPQTGTPCCYSSCGCQKKTFYFNYINSRIQRYLSHLTHLLEYQKSQKECFCYWPETSSLAGEINDDAFLIFKGIVEKTALSTIVEDWEVSTEFQKGDREIESIPYLVMSLVVHQFRFSHYYHVYRDISEWAFTRYSNADAMLIRYELEDMLERLYPKFVRLYNNCLEKHPNAEIEKEIEFMRFLKRDIWGLAQSSSKRKEDSFTLSARGKTKKDKKKNKRLKEYVPKYIVSENNEFKVRDREFISAYSYMPYFAMEKSVFLNEFSLFSDAIGVINQALLNDPENDDLYSLRARVYFDSGNIKKAIKDYKNAKRCKENRLTSRSVILTCPPSFELIHNNMEFSRGLAVGACSGCKDSVIELGPSLLHCCESLGSGLWSLVCSPKEVSKELVQSAFELGSYLSTLSTQEQLEFIIPELKELALNWNALDYYERGRQLGYITGKYGTDVFLPASVTVKGIRIVNKFKSANTMLTIGACAASESNAAIILEASALRAGKAAACVKEGVKRKILVKNMNIAHQVMHQKQGWELLILRTENIQEDFGKVLMMLEDHAILNKEFMIGDPLFYPSASSPKIMLAKHKKLINGCEVEAVFETYLESGKIYIQNAKVLTKWKFGSHKTASKWLSQLEKRGWTSEQITEAIEKGVQFEVENLINKGNKATRYVHPHTGRSVVIDNATKEIIHVGGNDFKY